MLLMEQVQVLLLEQVQVLLLEQVQVLLLEQVQVLDRKDNHVHFLASHILGASH